MSDFQLYYYTPSLAAAAIFILFFISTTSLHAYQAAATQTWFLTPLIIGGIFEVLGYVARAQSSHQSPNWSLEPYIMQSLLILLAPLLFAATIYMKLGRIVKAVGGEKQSLVRPAFLTKIFVAGDVFSFLIQGSGGGIMSQGKNLRLGSNIIVTGLFVQLIFFGFFIVIGITFNRRINRNPTALSRDPTMPWQKHLYAMHGASGLIMVRSIFRVVEYMQGFHGYLLEHEIFLYVFDAFLMLTVMVLFNFVHPSEVKATLQGGKVISKVFRTRRWKV